MYKLAIAVLAFLNAMPLIAQRRIDFLLDAEGARRTGHNLPFSRGFDSIRNSARAAGPASGSISS
jgi:hypothetical protein